MKKLLFICAVSLLAASLSADEVEITLEVSNVDTSGGKIYAGVYFTKKAWDSTIADIIVILEPTAETVRKTFRMEPGKCMIGMYQDINKNENQDANFLGIPKEPIGVSGWKGKGFPGHNFNKDAITLDGTTNKVNIGLFSL